MDPLNRFLTLILKDMKSIGFVKTLENNVENVIRKGFEVLTEIAVAFFKYIIRKCFSCFTNNSSSNNPIINIIYNLINEFGLTNFETITQYIKAAIDLLNKLLGSRNSPYPDKIKEITSFKEVEIKHCRSCTCTSNVNNTYRGDIGISSTPVTETKNTSQNKTTGIKGSIPVTETRDTSQNKPTGIKGSIPVTETRDTFQNKTTGIKGSIPVTETKDTFQNKITGGIVGTRRANHTNFKGVEKKISYYVGRVSLTTNEQHIMDHLNFAIPDGHFECIKLKSYKNMQSFKLTANVSSQKGIEDPNNWPQGVWVRPWGRKNNMSTKTTWNKMTVNNGIEVP